MGVNVSADAFVGFVKNGIDSVAGKTINQNIALGQLSFTTFHDAKTGEAMGFTLGLGPGPLPAGYSGAYDVTGTATIRNFINWVMPQTPSPTDAVPVLPEVVVTAPRFESNNSSPAAGGYLIYPNKSNTNMMRSVYAK